MKPLRSAVAGVLVAVAACCAMALPSAAQVSDPPGVVDAYERARTGQDVDAALGLFADDAMIRVEDRQTQQFSGKDQIRYYLSVQVARNIPQVTSSRHVVGATVTWTEHGVADFAVEAVVRRGKIASLVYRPAPQVASSSTIPAPLLFAAAVATLGLLVVGARALLNAGAPAVSARSRLRGHLLADLDQWHDARRA